MKLLTLPLLLALLGAHAHGYKILGIFGAPSQSHNILAKGIVDALLKAGHEVTWATTFPEKAKPQPNLHIIDISVTLEFIKGIDMTAAPDLSVRDLIAKNITNAVVNTKALRDVIVTQQFDAVINEWFLSDVDAGYAAVQQVPWIVLSGMVMHPHLEGLVDEVRSVTTVPMMMFSDHASLPMTFWDRVYNVAMYGMMWFYELMLLSELRRRFQNETIRTLTTENKSGTPPSANMPVTLQYLGSFKRMRRKQSEFASQYEKHFGPLAASRGVTLPPFSEAKHNISVLLVNSHPSISTAQVLPANAVYIAGYHISEKTEPLPKDLQEILDSSKQGVVYFSMGSVVKSEMIPQQTIKDLVQMFKETPYTVLWKFDEVPTGLSKNVHVRSWFPQASVLAHPNVKLFITHGGQLSTLEAIHYGIPLLAVPVFGDQPSNAVRAVRSGYAKMVPFSEHMVPELRVTLKEMLADDRYYKRAKYLSKLFNTRPASPSKLISHYVELAIESKGAYHLRSPSQLYAWYERWMLDLVALLLLLVYVVKVTLTRTYRALFSKDAKKQPQGKVKRN